VPLLTVIGRRWRRVKSPAPGGRLERGTLGLGVLALGTTGAVAALELARVWRRGSAPLPAEADHVLGAAAVAARETTEVTLAGYHESTRREAALLNLLVSFEVAFGLARVSTWTIRRRGNFGPFRNVTWGSRHVHHFVPGILLAFGAGAASIVSRNEGLDPWLALPFGAGVGLTLDESALLLRLDDVYWTEEGLLSVQISLTTMALVAGGALATRLLRRGEAQVLEGPRRPAQATARTGAVS
jgi:hypothetical protein